MGLFDKLFGGAGGAKPDGDSSIPSSSPPPAADPSAPPVARRERSRPQVAQTTLPGTPASNDGENAPLLDAIAGVVANDTPITRATLYQSILESHLYLVSMTPEGAEPMPAGEITLLEGQQLSLATIRDGEGRIYLPAFTDIERLSLSLPEREKARYLRVPTTSVCRMFLQGEGEGIVINPGQAPTGIITRGEAQVLATGTIPQVDESGNMVGQPQQQQMRIMIGKPDVPPAQSLLDAILAEAPKHPEIREVHIFKAGMEDQPPRLMIGMVLNDDLTPEQMQPTFEAVGKVLFEARGETEAFDMMPLNEQILEAIKPLEAVVYLRDQQA